VRDQLLPCLSPGRHGGEALFLPEGLWEGRTDILNKRHMEWVERASHRLSGVFLKILSSLFL